MTSQRIEARVRRAPPATAIDADRQSLTICLAQAYRDPHYIRGASLQAALQAVDSIRVVLAMNRSPGLARYFEAIRGLLQIKRQCNPEIYLLAFRGHEIAWLVRRLTRGRVFVFDAMMSPYAALAEERKHGRIGMLAARLWRPFEAMALRQADAVLTDTSAHAAYYQVEFGIPTEKIIVVPVGAHPVPTPAQQPQATDAGAPFRVLFYGSFLPLHGVDVILRASRLLHELPIQFDFIGGSERDAQSILQCSQTGAAVRYTHRRWVPIGQLLEQEIPATDLCLGGPFGNTPQSRRVITGKAHQALASGKAVVIGRIDDQGGFVDKHNCLLVDQGDPVALARVIRWAFEHRTQLPAIGANGRELHARCYAPLVLGTALVEALARLPHPALTSIGP